ncbi:hypothetical protein C8N24_1907 [Solirubrobacter pauli]|uniref:Uncharacterized protein n=1 Tax=Solirubrobacter pauli TaxID=166793 RepID=A0A660LAP6_9ACTN|nr:SitI3 family protein [Solirubrobacter pauli]RKQ92068.1 hypothetical protein C8N24_1907 [Solirubrobacter pauli]
MAVFYNLIIIGDTTADDFIARVYDDALPAPAFTPSNKAVAADETARLGFTLTLLETTDGYFQDDDWEIEPPRYLDVGFRVDKDADPEQVRANVDRFVDRALATGDEDMALINNGNTLLLERTDGEVRRRAA